MAIQNGRRLYLKNSVTKPIEGRRDEQFKIDSILVLSSSEGDYALFTLGEITCNGHGTLGGIERLTKVEAKGVIAQAGAIERCESY